MNNITNPSEIKSVNVNNYNFDTDKVGHLNRHHISANNSKMSCVQKIKDFVTSVFEKISLFFKDLKESIHEYFKKDKNPPKAETTDPSISPVVHNTIEKSKKTSPELLKVNAAVSQIPTPVIEEALKEELDLSLTPEYEKLLDAVNKKDKEAFQDLLSKIPKQKLADLIPEILQKVAPRLSNQETAFIFQNLIEKFPEVKEYMTLHNDNPILAPKGVEILVDYLKEKGSLKVDCFVCNDIADFIQKWEGIQSAQAGSKFSFIVRCRSEFPSPFTNHMTPIYAEKTEKGWNVLHSDAAGDFSSIPITVYFAQIIKTPDIAFYSGGSGRQRDPTSCPVFCLRDIVQCSNHPDIFQYLSKSVPAQDPNLEKEPEDSNIISDMITVKSLNMPIEMMTVTQNKELLEEYQAKHGDDKVKGLKETVTFSEKMQKHQFTIIGKNATPKTVNNLIHERGLKYQRIILRHILQNSP